MSTEPASPKRRHILSSINPDRRSASPKTEDGTHAPSEDAPAQEPKPDPEQATEAAVEEEGAETRERKRPSKFRFKKKSSRPHRHSSRDHDRDYGNEPNDEAEESSHRHHRHRHHHRHHHHRHKRRRTRSPSPSPPPPANPFEAPPLGSDAAFRESLFDAMADDEGAAYWENVYGQPIHVYSRSRSKSHEKGTTGGAGDGELEQMNDDEYAAFVRQKMWEKTHEGLLEERARREEARRRRDGERDEAKRLTREMERSLRRGEERRRKKGWRERWEDYGRAWETWDGTLEGVVWPVRSGKREDVNADAVKDFYVLGIDPEDVGESEFLARLKEERVRWHPDKMQQRLGGKVEQDVMRDVTAVFQIVDKLWSDTRSKKQ
ncbi:hypothetical protein M426DRAFT_19066 [Hypoxylon sp. CI-4A]|nr:hypothetical protein M426DRAFT_19066 [Hypoxylon sp. CI-4A]